MIAEEGAMAKRKKPESPARISACLSFDAPGPQNTDRTLAWAARCAEELGVGRVLVATTSGETGVKALEHFPADQLVVVTHSTGFSGPDVQELEEKHRKRIEAAGAEILTCQHAFGGVGRAVRRKLGTYELDEIMAYTLRIFGQGTKVAVEIALMAADAGLVPHGIPCISIGGTQSGADTALLLQPCPAQSFFDMKVMEVLARPAWRILPESPKKEMKA
jgi:uncharacterized protein